MIISIDASTTGCSVALFQDFKVLAYVESRKDRSSAENLTLMIERTLKIAKVNYKDLEAVAVAKSGFLHGLKNCGFHGQRSCFWIRDSFNLLWNSACHVLPSPRYPFYGFAMPYDRRPQNGGILWFL